MLCLLLASIFLILPGRGISSIQADSQAPTATVNAKSKLSPPELSDLQKQADSGDASAQFKLGKAYETGDGVPQRPDKAATWYLKAAEQGNAKAQNGLGVLYYLGEGVEKNKEEALRWYHKAARQGDGAAMFNLGAAYYNGEGGVAADGVQAYAWFLLSSAAGDAAGQDAAKRSQSESPFMFRDACVKIGEMYAAGQDVPKSFDSAAQWYRKADELGSNKAVVGLAQLYLMQNKAAEALPFCEKAAKQKLSGGYFCLGFLYQHGLSVPQDPKKALKLYEEGAQWSHAPSMQAAAEMFERGEGTSPDRSQAFVWFLRAARAGSHDALVNAQRLRSTMTEKEYKRALKKLPAKYDPKMVDAILRDSNRPPTQ